MQIKRMSYIKRLQEDLATAMIHNRQDLMLSILETISKYKKYKHNWYISNKKKVE